MELIQKTAFCEFTMNCRLILKNTNPVGFFFLPLGLILISLFVVNQHLVKGISLGFLIKENVFLLSSVSIVLVGLVMLVINSWANVFYGKYVKQIKIILDDLIEE